MSDWNLGSIADEIHNLVSVPTLISGTTLLNIVDRRRLFMEQYLDVSIGSTAIQDKYQGPLIKFSVSDILIYSNPNGMNKMIKIDVLEINKSSSGVNASISWEQKAMDELKALKGRYNFSKAFG